MAKPTKMKLYGPRLKLMVTKDRSLFSMLLDEFDEQTEESKIVILEIPRGQLEEWVTIFKDALGTPN